jgi:hypothetical protein
LAYGLPDGRLKPIDGHLRRAMDPNMEVDVEILDVNDEEACALLLSIDPLARLAMQQEQLQTRLLEMTPTVNPDLRALWEQADAGWQCQPSQRARGCRTMASCTTTS